ncbi:MAG: alpha/beta fold hydrolase [Rhodococcus sp. (in: high G+C Gram-positive bacteria)]|uniref:alpha/beta fold hydrolase n=1 Tax=Rhodococcus sp. TaxID=1831 RepID=UPI003BB7600C
MAAVRIVGVFALTVGILVGSAATARPAPVDENTQVPVQFADQALAWTGCAEQSLVDAVTEPDVYAVLRAPMLRDLECATVHTPLDWSRPDDGRSVEFRISRLRATPQDRTPKALLTSPGGAGAGNLTSPSTTARALPQLRDVYDLYGFDARGTATSTSAQRCDRNLSGDPQLLGTGRYDTYDTLDFSPESLARQFDEAQRWMWACANGADRTADGTSTLGYVNYWQTARDLDLARHLIGVPTWSYLGASQGTALGAELIRTFPHRIDRWVFDSVASPSRTTTAAGIFDRYRTQYRRLEEDFVPWLAGRDTAFGGTPTEVLASLTALRANLVQKPVQLPGDRSFSGNDLNVVLLGVGNVADEALAMTLSTVLAADRDRSGPQTIQALVNVVTTVRIPVVVGEQFETAAFGGDRSGWWTSMNCGSGTWERDPNAVAAEARAVAHDAPLTYLGMGLTAACAFWPEGNVEAYRGGGDDVPAGLIVHNEHDTVTALSDAQQTRAALPRSRLVTVAGKHRHLVLPVVQPLDTIGAPGTSVCATDTVLGYLLDGVLTPADIECRADDRLEAGKVPG